ILKKKSYYMWSTVTPSRIASRPFPTPEGVSPSRTDADASPVHQGSQPMHAPDQQRPEGRLWGRRAAAAANLPSDVAKAFRNWRSASPSWCACSRGTI
ncbi:MAG: hypothetical protein LBE98_00005, partial [Puniceicoccales bacterium]|nr:hypothetical protein [Puniceicoccales bacterium]